MSEDARHMCPHCRAVGGRHLGECSVCHHVVCEKCGNVQHVRGETRVSHNECVKNDDDAFSMIKFVR